MMKLRKWLPMMITTGLFVTGASASAADIQKDHLAFAKSKKAINIRTEANTDSIVVAKLSNKSAVTVLEILDDGWCFVSSGDALGYMKSKYLVAGEEAQKIADEVAYNVAVVYPKALNVRAKANDDSSVIDVVKEKQELEVVSYDGGAWMQVAVAPDSIGYIDASHCGYKTYYPVAQVINEEALSLVSVPKVSESEVQETIVVPAQEEAVVNETVAGSEDVAYDEEESAYEETPSYEEQPVYEEAPSYEEPVYEEVPSYEEPVYEETPSYEEPVYEETPSYEEPVYEETPSYEEPAYEEVPSYSEEPVYEEVPSYNEDTTYEEEYVQAPSSDGSAGQAIADYAVQFVGNPYVYGGTSLTNGTDCSGFTQSVMSNFGINTARVAADQANGGTAVSTDELLPGDLLFYSEGSGISHVALYIGDGQIVHAATEDQGIIISNYDYSAPVSASRYW